MMQLNQQTAEVLKEINDDGRPAMITKRGRFIAMIVPLVSANIESTVVNAIVEEVEDGRQLTGEHTLENLRTTGGIAEDIDVSLPAYPERDVWAWDGGDAISRGSAEETPSCAAPAL